MTRTLIGKDYAGVGCVKITKGSFDPATTLDSERAKFLFNSKWAQDVKVQGIRAGWSGQARGYYGAGWDYWSSGTSLDIVQKSIFGSGLPYDFPLFDRYSLDGSGNYSSRQTIIQNAGNLNETTAWRILPSGQPVSWTAAGSVYQFSGSFAETVTTTQPNVMCESNQRVMVWRLPGDNTAIENGSALSPVAGHAQVLINPSTLKVSKPGFNAYTASGTELAFDSSNIPAKIVAAGDVFLPTGTTVIELGYSVPELSVVDAHFYRDGQAIHYPAEPLSQVLGAVYRLSGTQLIFTNGNAGVRARYIVVAASTDGPTSGTNNVLRQFDAGGQNVVQFLRPGASASPTFADIVLDSRWPAMQILGEGYIAVGSGAQTHSISYDATGMFPFVKFVTVHGGGSLTTGTFSHSFSKMIRPPQMTVWRWAGPAGNAPSPDYYGGDTCYVTYGETGATFYTFRGNPIYQSRTVTGGTSTVNTLWDSAEIQGIRYYVFGIAL